MSGTENATATVTGTQTSPGVFRYTITLTDAGTTPIGTFWFAWDDVPDQDFMTVLPTNIGAPAGWTEFVTQHAYPGGTGYGIEWLAIGSNSAIAIGASSSAFTFTSTETPAAMAAVSPFDHTFQTTSSFVYRGGAFSTPGGNFTVAVACFREGTLIRTPQGERPVQDLRPGDRILTAEGRIRSLIWRGQRRVACRQHSHPEQVWPVRIQKNALGPAEPSQDLFLSPDHALCFDDILVPVKYLINGTTIAQIKIDTVIYHHLELDSHDVIVADGALAETYLDTGERGTFDDPPGEIAATAVPSSREIMMVREAASCLPIVVTGPMVAGLRERLARRADWLREAKTACEAA